MPDNVTSIRGIVTNLEAIQRQIGQAQLELLNILTDEIQDEWDQPAQEGLVRLETVQRSVGEIQVLLVKALPVSNSTVQIATIETTDQSASTAAVIVEVEQTKLAFADPQEWLDKRGIKIKSLPSASGIDKSADGAALFLGDHYDHLENFFEAIKRAVNRNFDEGWFPVEDLPPATIGAICRFATKLHGCGFFTSFRYFKRNPSRPNQKPGMRFAPLHEKRINRFFKGGWLERYVEQVVREAFHTAFGRQTLEPIIREVQVVLPTGCEAEFDLLAGLTENRIIWLESKTGEWRQYVPRFRELNQRFLKLPPGDAALVVAERLADDEKASISALSGMTPIHITELRNHLASKVSVSSEVERVIRLA